MMSAHKSTLVFAGPEEHLLASGAISAYQEAIIAVEKLDCPKLPTIPKFMADFITAMKNEGIELKTVTSTRDVFSSEEYEKEKQWMLDNYDDFTTAWLQDYQIQKEPKYYAKTITSLIDDWDNGGQDYFTITPDFGTDKVHLDLWKAAYAMTIDEWAKLGIGNSVAIFESAEEGL